jgi:calcium-dependent protein kinase
MDHGHDSTAQVKLIDFGYGAKFFGNLPMRTKCGTPYTTAPEVLRECYDERCDVWSIGVVLYIMLSGRRPFETLEVAGGLKEAGRAAMIASILACRYHFDHPTFRTVSDEAKIFVQKLLLPDYLQRMTSDEALEYPWLRSKGQSNVEYNAQLMHISTSSKGSRAINNMKVSAWNAAKNLPMVPLAFSLNANQTAEIRALFQSFDRDCSGSLSRDEYVKVKIPQSHREVDIS